MIDKKNNKNENLSLFLGCIAPNRYPGIETATRKIMNKLNIEVKDLNGASCCPAPGVFKSFDKTTWLTLASRNVVLSENQETDLITICNGCYGSLGEANNILKSNPDIKEKVNQKLKEIGLNYKGTIDVRHIVEYLYTEVTTEIIKKYIKFPLKGLKVAVHYGCHLINPSKEKHLKNSENPTFFDELVNVTGAESVNYEDKMVCCGAGGGARSAFLETTLKMTKHKLDIIASNNFDCIVNACPFCHLQFDSGQYDLNKKSGTYNIPVLHYTQLLGLSFGYTPDELGISMNLITNKNFEEKVLSIIKKGEKND